LKLSRNQALRIAREPHSVVHTEESSARPEFSLSR
jgi:hypothetical protein